MNRRIKHELFTIWLHCDINDDSTEKMIALMQSKHGLTYDRVVEFIEEHFEYEKREPIFRKLQHSLSPDSKWKYKGITYDLLFFSKMKVKDKWRDAITYNDSANVYVREEYDFFDKFEPVIIGRKIHGGS